MVDVEQTCCDEANGMLSGLTNKQSSLSTIEEIYVYSQIEFEFQNQMNGYQTLARAFLRLQNRGSEFVG